MWTSALFGKKNFGFFEIYGVSAQTMGEGVESVRTFFGQGVNFSRFCAVVFYGRPLNLIREEKLGLKPVYYC